MSVPEARDTAPRPVTVRDLAAPKRPGERVVMVAAYDALFGRLVDDAGAFAEPAHSF